MEEKRFLTFSIFFFVITFLILSFNFFFLPIFIISFFKILFSLSYGLDNLLHSYLIIQFLFQSFYKTLFLLFFAFSIHCFNFLNLFYLLPHKSFSHFFQHFHFFPLDFLFSDISFFLNTSLFAQKISEDLLYIASLFITCL